MVPTLRKKHQGTFSHCLLVGHGTKWAKNANIFPKMTTDVNFGPNLAVFGLKSLIFMGVSNSFCIHLRKNHLIILFALCFIRAWTHMGQYLAKNTSLGPKILIIMGVSKSFGSHKNGITTKATYSHCFLVGYWIKWAKNKSSCPNLAIFGPKIIFLRGWGKTIGILF